MAQTAIRTVLTSIRQNASKGPSALPDDLVADGNDDTVETASLRELSKLRLEWIATRSKAAQELNRLKEALNERYKDDADEKPTLISALSKLDGVMEELDESLGDQLDSVINAAGMERMVQSQIAGRTLDNFLQYIQSDDLVCLLDGNEFLPDMQFAAPMRNKLEEIVEILA